MLEIVLIFTAIGLRLLAGAHYFAATCTGKVQPNPVTWLFWGLAPLVAFVAQIQSGLKPSAWVTLALAVGPLAIFVAAISKEKQKRWQVGIFDLACGVLAAAGIVLWQITDNPLVALIFGILADTAGGIPTLRKSYSAPHTEHALPYFLSVLSMVVTLFSLRSWNFIDAAFPIYILCINITLFSLIVIGSTVKRHRRGRRYSDSL